MSGPDDARKRAFAQRLNTLMGEKELTPKQVASCMQAELGEKFNGVNLSHYRAGRSMPRPRYLKALCAAVGVQSDALLGPDAAYDRSHTAVPANDMLPEMRIEEVSTGEAYLQLNRCLPWSTVLRVLEALKLADASTAAGSV